MFFFSKAREAGGWGWGSVKEMKEYLQQRSRSWKVILDNSHVFVSKGTSCKIDFYCLLVLLTSGDVWIPETSCKERIESHRWSCKLFLHLSSPKGLTKTNTSSQAHIQEIRAALHTALFICHRSQNFKVAAAHESLRTPSHCSASPGQGWWAVQIGFCCSLLFSMSILT